MICRYKYQLDAVTTVLFLSILLVGLRDRLPIVERLLNLPPHFMQFNMYVWDIQSPTDPMTKAADFYVPVIGKNFTNHDLQRLQPTLGALIQGDRWKGFQPAIQKYFCAIKDKIGVKQSSFEVVSIYIRNGTQKMKEIHVIKCN